MDQYYDSSLNGCSHHAPCCFIDNASLKTLVSSPLTSLLLYQLPLEHPQRACSKNLQMNKMEQKECSLWWQAGTPKF
jgi:hypothetical protein